MPRKKLSNKEAIVLGLNNGDSKSDLQCMLQMEPDKFEEAYNQALAMYADKLASRPTEHVYANFVINMVNLSRRLDPFAERQDPRDAVNAIKAQIEIEKEIIANGIKLGVVRPVGEIQNNFQANLTFIQNLSNSELKEKMLELTKDMQVLMEDKNDVDMMQLEASQTHYGPSVLEDEPQTIQE